MGGYDPKGREIIADFARVMNYLGTSYGVLRKEKCTGDPVRRLGNDLLFQQLAEANLENLAQNKVKKIVSICPHCVRTIQEDWKEYGTPPEIEHHSEFLARFIDKLPPGEALKGHNLEPFALEQALKGHDFSRAADESESTRALAPEGSSSGAATFNPTLVSGINSESSVTGHEFSRAENGQNSKGALAPAVKAPSPEKIVFHDPCYLGRYRNVYDEPRAVASLAGDLVEAPRNHERSFCCGAGGGLAFLGEETGQRVSNNRAAELVATGAQTIAAACPFCNTMFRDALASNADAAPQFLDIAQIAARNLPKTEITSGAV